MKLQIIIHLINIAVNKHEANGFDVVYILETTQGVADEFILAFSK
jgi:hypothetical protein